jgi:hypothetical protein
MIHHRSESEYLNMANDTIDELKDAGKRLLALFQDQEIDHPAAFSEFRKAFGYVEEPIPVRPTTITLPADDQIYETVKQFEHNKHVLNKAFEDNKDFRDKILATMGSADVLRFPDGTEVKRKVSERKPTSMPAVKYNTIRVDWRGAKS